jgi:hypothetical protein
MLDDHFDGRLSAAPEAPLHYAVALAESVCGRMADVEMYAFLIEDARKRHHLERSNLERDSDVQCAILTRSFLIGYLGACKALLDSVAVALATIYGLDLNNVERSFTKGEFWHQLVVDHPNVHRRYHPFRLFFNEIMQWYNETAQRIPPLIVLQRHFGQFARRESLLHVIDERDVDLKQLALNQSTWNWVDALELHRRWKTRLLMLCEKICQDIEANV